MRRLLDDARPGMRYSDTRGATWEYIARYGPDQDFLFPHTLRCVDTEQTDDFSPEGQDQFALKNCDHQLVWAVTGR